MTTKKIKIDKSKITMSTSEFTAGRKKGRCCAGEHCNFPNMQLSKEHVCHKFKKMFTYYVERQLLAAMILCVKSVVQKLHLLKTTKFQQQKEGHCSLQKS